MKINELKIPPGLSQIRKSGGLNNNFEWRDLLNDFLGTYDFNEIGSGGYASVYLNPKYPFALKVFKEDDSYLHWLNFCQVNPDNPYCVKVIGKPVRLGADVYAVRLEKLKPISHNKAIAVMLALAEHGAQLNPEMMADGTTIDRDKFESVFGLPIDNEWLAAIAEFIFEVDDEGDFMQDVHPENIMARGKQPVFIEVLNN